MIFVDSNVPMYLVGAAHPHKQDAQRVIERLIASEQRLVCDAEVLQEILHRYTAIGRKKVIYPVMELIGEIMDHFFRSNTRTSSKLQPSSLESGPKCNDALHIAVMERYTIKQIFTVDKDLTIGPDFSRISRQGAPQSGTTMSLRF